MELRKEVREKGGDESTLYGCIIGFPFFPPFFLGVGDGWFDITRAKIQVAPLISPLLQSAATAAAREKPGWILPIYRVHGAVSSVSLFGR